METTIEYIGVYIGIMERKRKLLYSIFRLVYWGLYWDHGKENGSYYILSGVFRG